MGRYILRRLLAIIPVLLGISVIVFALVHLVPGDVVSVLLGPTATPEARDALRKLFGLDRPLVVQYFVWLGDVLRGDFGESLRTGQPVMSSILDRFGVIDHFSVRDAVTQDGYYRVRIHAVIDNRGRTEPNVFRLIYAMDSPIHSPLPGIGRCTSFETCPMDL